MFQVSEYRIHTSDFRFQISDSSIKISGVTFQNSDFRIKISGFKFQMLDSRFRISDLRFQIPVFRFQISYFRFQISAFRFQISDFRIHMLGEPGFWGREPLGGSRGNPAGRAAAPALLRCCIRTLYRSLGGILVRENMKITKWKSVSAQNVGKVQMSRKKTWRPHLGSCSAFSMNQIGISICINSSMPNGQSLLPSLWRAI